MQERLIPTELYGSVLPQKINKKAFNFDVNYIVGI
uniref:Uncharacterized protein n=1 Tax=Arundo donax TaxID=35708 RepID=A0A0A9CLQ8_ARUDO